MAEGGGSAVTAGERRPSARGREGQEIRGAVVGDEEAVFAARHREAGFAPIGKEHGDELGIPPCLAGDE